MVRPEAAIERAEHAAIFSEAEAGRWDAGGDEAGCRIAERVSQLTHTPCVDFRLVLTPAFHPILTPPYADQPGYSVVDKSNRARHGGSHPRQPAAGMVS